MRKRLCIIMLGCVISMTACQKDSESLAEAPVLADKDFAVEYKGYTINGQTTEEDIKRNLGVPEDFEDNNNGYITTAEQELRWQLMYPNFTDQSDIRVIFSTNLEMDVTTIKTVALENLETNRGIKAGDSIHDVYEAYGLPDEEKPYESNAEYLEVDYVKENQSIQFIIDEESETIKYLYIKYNLSEDEE